MSFPCEECICLSICIACIEFEQRRITSTKSSGYFSFGYFMKLRNLTNRCKTVKDFVKNEESWTIVKRFFLEQKGLI